MVSQSVIKTVNAVTDAYMYTFTWKDPRLPLSHVDVFRRDNNIKKRRRFELQDKPSRSFTLISVSKYTLQQNNQPRIHGFIQQNSQVQKVITLNQNLIKYSTD